jgi:GNAT superfamily N-acetyltransferase
MNIRIAELADIREMFSVRMSVKENVLNNTALVTDEICEDYITRRGRGWVCEVDGKIVAFAIADLRGNSIWALFVRPEYEGKGIGRRLHDTMLNWYFGQTNVPLWLTTAPGTRAENFYTKAGWNNAGLENGEVKFELSKDGWTSSII